MSQLIRMCRDDKAHDPCTADVHPSMVPDFERHGGWTVENDKPAAAATAAKKKPSARKKPKTTTTDVADS